jgi:SulP family sulfate permease
MNDVKLVGDVPSGLPHLQWPALNQWERLMPSALSMALMVFLFGQSSSVALGRKRGERILADRELFALGASNLAAAISGSFPVTGSISRSAVNFQAGANTQLASVLSVFFLALALASSTVWLSLLPMPALAAMIILAVFSMMEWGVLAECWRVDRRDALTCFITIFGVILLGFNQGMLAGLTLSMLFALSSLGWSGLWLALRGQSRFILEPLLGPETHGYRIRLQGALLFANAETLAEALQAKLEGLAPEPRGEKIDLLIDLTALTDLDWSAIQALSDLHRSLRALGFKLSWTLPDAYLLARLEQERRLLGLIVAG